MASKVSELMPFFRLPSMQDLRKSVRVSEAQQQLSDLQQELGRAKEELAEMRKVDGESFQSKDKIRLVESQALRAREAERSMLEAMVSQTKQLEQTKISLEESKLEVRNLQDSIRNMEGLAKKNGSVESVTQEELRKEEGA
ncbi:hypothetical protein HPP92_002063 [Vanilla planifolia]|uniref:Uncharacterized protein n=1 Tax=Vanilla planifolia TaxID=51239 RepID=A0A835S8Z9_VANPL|nr:hypothetical protein HPP92_002063 [Vanilla planifolia]